MLVIAEPLHNLILLGSHTSILVCLFCITLLYPIGSDLSIAFAFFNPTTFALSQMTAGDDALYSEFTDVKSNYP